MIYSQILKTLFFSLYLIVFSSCHGTESMKIIDTIEYTLDYSKIKSKAIESKKYCLKNNMNVSFCLLADMSIHSGRNRFFIYDFIKDTIIYSCLVGHGCGSFPWAQDQSSENPSFSNQENSHCTSLGKYKLGSRGYSDWGIHIKYIMHGLDSTNSNSQKRFIVFHSWDVVSENETYPKGTPEGWGCPTISNQSMTIIDSMIKSQSKPVLLWQFK